MWNFKAYNVLHKRVCIQIKRPFRTVVISGLFLLTHHSKCCVMRPAVIVSQGLGEVREFRRESAHVLFRHTRKRWTKLVIKPEEYKQILPVYR